MKPKPKNAAAVALGSIKSPRKAKSSARNGRKGGRPPKPAHVIITVFRGVAEVTECPDHVVVTIRDLDAQ